MVKEWINSLMPLDVISQEFSRLVTAVASSDTNTTGDECTSPGDWTGRHAEVVL